MIFCLRPHNGLYRGLRVRLLTVTIYHCHGKNSQYEQTVFNLLQTVKAVDGEACFTTCWARLKLYDVIDFLGERVLYMDTDSIIFKGRSCDPMSPKGDYLGELTDELPLGHYIKEYISSGPKSYRKEETKFKGITIFVIKCQVVVRLKEGGGGEGRLQSNKS